MGKMILESKIENNVVAYAIKRDLVHRKLNGMGNRSWPDQMFLGPGGKTLYIEFKKLGAQPTPLQLENHKMLRALGMTVAVIDTIEEGRACIDWFVEQVP
jgi:hypothetical protein